MFEDFKVLMKNKYNLRISEFRERITIPSGLNSVSEFSELI
jgi:hypothetical protein